MFSDGLKPPTREETLFRDYLGNISHLIIIFQMGGLGILPKNKNEKNDHLKMYLLLKMVIFHCLLSFLGVYILGVLWHTLHTRMIFWPMLAYRGIDKEIYCRTLGIFIANFLKILMYINEDHMMGPIVIIVVFVSQVIKLWVVKHSAPILEGSWIIFSMVFRWFPIVAPGFAFVGKPRTCLLDLGIRASFIEVQQRLLDQGPSADSFVGDALTTYHPKPEVVSQPSVFFRQAGSFRGGIPQNLVSFWLHIHVRD